MPRIDVVVIGAGAIGASAAWHLARAGRRVMVLEKEPGPALHQSGRNSGVVHAGYNVKPGTAKARFCIEGNRQLRAYCAERGDRKSTRLNSSHTVISYAVFCLKKKKKKQKKKTRIETINT